METKTEDEVTITGWQYPIVAGFGSLIVVGYIAGAIAFLGYILFLIARLYQWIIDFGQNYGLFWGVVIGILAFLGVILATVIVIIVLIFLFNKFQQYRLKIKMSQS